MIVPSMTPEEVYREIEQDMPNVENWWMRQRDIIAKRVRNMIRFPKKEWYEYKSHRHNRYFVFSIVFGRKYNNNSMTAVLALQKMEHGNAIYFTRWSWQMLANRIVILPHVFDRYSDPERFNVQKSGVELIKHFVMRNSYGEPTEEDKFSGRSVRYNGKDNLCMSMRDGVLLGERRGDIFVAHTFITYEMATGLQKKEFESKRDKLKDESELMYTMKKMYQ